VRVGELVEINRAGVGTPMGTIGLIMERALRRDDEGGGRYVYTVQLIGKPDTVRTRCFLDKELRVIK